MDEDRDDSTAEASPLNDTLDETLGRYDTSRVGAERMGEPVSKRILGWIAVLVALIIVVGGGWVLVDRGLDAVDGLFAGPPDYEGDGRGSVLFEVHEGDSTAEIGRNLKADGVVKSVEAFTDAAADDDRSLGIQVGFYQLSKRMPAESVLGVLVDPDNLVQASVTVPEGLTVEQIVQVLARKTDFSAKQYTAALAKPGRLGLPSYAGGDPQGYLFPATYQVKPRDTPASVLRMMVDRFKEAAADLDLEFAAEEGNVTPHEIVTVASIIEREVRRERDLAGVAEVTYNRLNGHCPDSGRLLQMDSTVHYAAGANDSVFTTEQMRQIDSPYNTYRYAGLPPGPISAPGQAALSAALNPSHKGWCYFVAVNLDTGATRFATNAAGHAANRARLEKYCRGSDLC